MVRYHMGLDRDGPRGKRLRPLIGLLAYQSIAGEHLRALPGAAAVEMGHNFSLVHDDIEDRGAGAPPPARALDRGRRAPGHQHRRHAVHARRGWPSIASPTRASRTRRSWRLMRLYDETCLALCEGQFMDIWTTEHDEWLTVDWLLRHDRPQDRGAHRGFRAGGRDAGDRRRGHRVAVPALRLVARPRLPAQRRPARASGATSRRPARRPPTSRPARRRCRSSTPSRRRRAPTASGSTRSSVRPAMTPPPTKRTRCAPSSSASAPVPTRARGPRGTVTTRSQEIASMGIIEREARERLELIVRAAISA